MSKQVIARGVALVVVLLSFTGCPNCAPDLVAEGLSRLTIRNVGAMVSLINADPTCGFESAAVKGAPAVDGVAGGTGSLTFTVENCEIDLATPVEVSADCQENKTFASGKITISATKTIAGTLTGDAESPIIPGGPDSVTLTISNATFENFDVTKSNSQNSLRMISGAISAIAKPRLGVSESKGVCAIATPNVTFSEVTYSPSTVHLTSPDNSFDADVATSSITAQSGKNGTENSISGRMTVFGSDVEVTGDGLLDPDYVPADFLASYACVEDLAAPDNFDCVDPMPALADGAARLTIKALGTVAGLVDANDACGFSSAAVQQAATLQGTPGGLGSLTLTVTNCAIAFDAVTALADDCNGDHTIVSGSVTVSGTKTLSGRVTGDPASPIVPVTEQPAEIALSIVVDGFSVGSNADPNVLIANSGTLTGTVSPKVFIGAETGVCSVSSPNAGFDDVTWTDASLELDTESASFVLLVDAADLEAANGTSASGTNELAGTVTIDGEAYTVPSDGDGLNPDFNQAELDASWQCDPDLAAPVSDQCGAAFGGILGAGAAPLTMRTFGTAVSLVDANTTCGFRSVAVAGTPTFAGGDVGDDGVTATFTLPNEGCTITLPAGSTISVDCLGTVTTASGSITVTGTKTVTGFRTGDPLEPIVPTSFKPATFDLDVTFNEFVVENAESTAALTVHGGSLSGVAQPRVALDPFTNACSIGTPNVTFSDIAWTNGVATLQSGAAAFDMTINASDLDAQSGSDLTTTNALSGSITVDGFALNGIDGVLDPAFDQLVFDSTYTCEPAGSPVLVSDAECSARFRTVLGQGAARLLVKAAATATGILDGNNTCGFADPAPDTAPVITGDPGTIGNVTLTADANCVNGPFPANFALGTPDCLGTQTRVSGTVAIAGGTKSINGFLTGANPPVFPVTRDAATLTVDDIAFTTFEVFDELADQSVAARITVTGTADVVVEPIAGRSDSASAQASAATGGAVQNVFAVKTPVARISDLTMASADVVLVSGRKTFNLALTNVDLDVFAGFFFNGATEIGTNDIAGSLTVDGIPVAIDANSELVAPLDPQIFTSTYACNPDLAGDFIPFQAP